MKESGVRGNMRKPAFKARVDNSQFCWTCGNNFAWLFNQGRKCGGCGHNYCVRHCGSRKATEKNELLCGLCQKDRLHERDNNASVRLSIVTPPLSPRQPPPPVPHELDNEVKGDDRLDDVSSVLEMRAPDVEALDVSPAPSGCSEGVTYDLDEETDGAILRSVKMVICNRPVLTGCVAIGIAGMAIGIAVWARRRR